MNSKVVTVKHIYSESIKLLRFQYNHERKYMQIFGIAHHHKHHCRDWKNRQIKISKLKRDFSI